MQQLKSLLVLPIYHSSIIKCLVDQELIDTSKFYKLFYIISGTITVSLKDRRFIVSAGSIVVKQPGDHLKFYGTQEAEGYFCLFNFDYLMKSSLYLMDVMLFFPFYVSPMHINLSVTQSEIVRNCFDKIINEEREGLSDKKQATLLHLQMIMLQCRRASKSYARNDLFYFTNLN